MAEAAVEAAHREEDALIGAGRELATCADLQLLRQAETWSERSRRHTLRRRGDRLDGGCSQTCGGRRVEAVLLMLAVGVVRLRRDVDPAHRRLLHPVGVSEVEAALEGALVFCNG